jgi:hypothetical protein
MTKPEAKDGIAFGEENNRYYSGTGTVHLYLVLACKRKIALK